MIQSIPLITVTLFFPGGKQFKRIEHPIGLRHGMSYRYDGQHPYRIEGEGEFTNEAEDYLAGFWATQLNPHFSDGVYINGALYQRGALDD